MQKLLRKTTFGVFERHWTLPLCSHSSTLCLKFPVEASCFSWLSLRSAGASGRFGQRRALLLAARYFHLMIAFRTAYASFALPLFRLASLFKSLPMVVTGNQCVCPEALLIHVSVVTTGSTAECFTAVFPSRSQGQQPSAIALCFCCTTGPAAAETHRCDPWKWQLAGSCEAASRGRPQ